MRLILKNKEPHLLLFLQDTSKLLGWGMGGGGEWVGVELCFETGFHDVVLADLEHVRLLSACHAVWSP